MIYRFVFGKGRLAILLAGVLFLGLLLFAAGLLSGMRWQLARDKTAVAVGPQEAPPATSAGAVSVPSTAASAAIPRPPAVSPAAPVVTPPRVQAPAVTQPPAPTVAAPTPVAVGRAAGGLAAASPAPAAAAAPESPQPPAVEPAPVDLTPATIYELQLGLYMRVEDAEAFVATMAERGYESYLVEVRSSRGSVLQTVRLGPFPSMEIAAGAAQRFQADQGFQPIIRFRRQPAKVAPPPDPDGNAAPAAPPAAVGPATGDG